jgi:hypothetical protein
MNGGESVVQSAAVSQNGHQKLFCEQLLQWGAKFSAFLRHVLLLMDASLGMG